MQGIIAKTLTALSVSFVLLGCNGSDGGGDGRASSKAQGGAGGTAGSAGNPSSWATGGSGGSNAGEGTLCAKYGGPDVIMQVMQENVLGEIAADCRINAFFAPLRPEIVAHIGECLGIMAQELFACPSVVYAGSKSSSGRECRDMKSAHLNIGVSQGDFDALIEDVVAGLSAAGVEEADIMMAAPALLGMQSDIVEIQETSLSKPVCATADADAGSASAQEAGTIATADASSADGG